MSQKSVITFIIALSALLKLVVSNVKLVGPTELLSLLNNNDTIPHKIGKFGKVPYTHSIYGRIFYKDDINQTEGCNINSMNPFDYDIENINSPIILLQHGNCEYTKKAWNAELIGGGIAVIISDQNELEEDDPNNYDDGLGEKIKIPTVIIPKKIGETIKKFMKDNPHLQVYVTLRISFNMKQTDNVGIKFFLNSADARSVQFFTEFENYYKRLGSRIKIEPIYKYYKCSWCDYDRGITNDNCIDKGNYCGSTSSTFKIRDGLKMLQENVRQKCIYNSSQDKYWEYMIKFGKTCADYMEPQFTEDCAKNAMKAVGIDSAKVDTCYNGVFDKTKPNTSILQEDYKLFSKHKIFQIPQLRINNEKFRGSWYSKNVLEAICDAMSNPADICLNSPAPEVGMGWGTIFFIIVLIILVNIVFIYCYKRIVNRSLESSIEDKIQTQTIFSIGQYKMFTDAEPSKKVLVRNEDI